MEISLWQYAMPNFVALLSLHQLSRHLLSRENFPPLGSKIRFVKISSGPSWRKKMLTFGQRYAKEYNILFQRFSLIVSHHHQF